MSLSPMRPTSKSVQPGPVQELLVDTPISNVTLPKTLERLSLGPGSGPLVGVDWPDSLKSISFTETCCQDGFDGFNRHIYGAVWPPFLETMSMGYTFNQPIEDVAWPSSLRQLD